MKALIYKELKLAMHPICYVFILLFPFMILIPNYPSSVGFIYVLTAYPILFLGANKGQQSNDLLYSVLLPVRKKDVVLARIVTIGILQGVFILITSALLPLAYLINSTISIQSVGASVEVGIGLDGYISTLGIILLGYAIADLIFIPMYYKSGKFIVFPTLLTIFTFSIYIALTTIIIPYIPGCEWYLDILQNKGIGIQLIVLAIGLLIYIATHILIYKISSKRLEKVDF